MGLQLSFKIHPPSPYHTVNFHLKRGIRQKWHYSSKNSEEIDFLLSDLLENFKIITGVPDHFSVCIWPSRIHILTALISFYKQNIYLRPDENNHNIFMQPDFMGRNLFDQMLSRQRMDEIKSVSKDTAIYVQETDFITGRILDNQSIISIKYMNPDIKLFLDISCSFVNQNINYDQIDGFIFSTDQVLGLFPGVTISLIRNDLLKNLIKEWGPFFNSDPQKKITFYNQLIIYHREVDLLKLYVLNEICRDLIERDMTIIRNEMIYKSIILYDVLETNTKFNLLVGEKNDRSINVICAQLLRKINECKNYFNQKNILLDYINNEKFGYIVRIGNFPAQSKEQMIYLADVIGLF